MTTSSMGAFVDGLSRATGLDPRVIAAWATIEGAYAPNGTGGFNFLNLRAKSPTSGYSGVPLAGQSGNGFAQFRNVQDAVTETAYWINRFSNYSGIRASVRQGPAAQISAIASSPWDAGHYGGDGSSLRASYGTGAPVTRTSGRAGGNIGRDARAQGAGKIGGQVAGAVGGAVRRGVGDAVGILPGGPVLQGALGAAGGPVTAAKSALDVFANPTKYLEDAALYVLFLGLGFLLLYQGIVRLFGVRRPTMPAGLALARAGAVL